MANNIRFEQKLILNRWLLNLFEVADFDKLADELKDPEYEGFTEDNISKHHLCLCSWLFGRKELPFDLLLQYDQNIVRYWKQITENRNRMGHILYPKYFQYLSLLFTEIYLDRYFLSQEKLLEDLNTLLNEYNGEVTKKDQLQPFSFEDLNKIAFWMATGSGKTLVMHINILQYKYYLEKYKVQRKINKIILLTPNEGLSYQHLQEFQLSGLKADIFSKDNVLFGGTDIEIIDIHKLREESGDKTVAVESFEGNNLVLVDEGHKGSSGKEWMDRRNALCENGFSFEYSATFGQAVKASSNLELEHIYAKCILFDYSYRFFYKDGYGKEYRILNLENDSDENIRNHYLIACLLVFYQQQKIYLQKKRETEPYLIEKPLWIFVGSSVNAVRTENKRQVSDVVDILLFIADFVSSENKNKVIQVLDSFLSGNSGLLDKKGNDLFRGAFSYLTRMRQKTEQLYADILITLFSTNISGLLHVENLKGSDGEIALRIGDNAPFGLINVGDTSSLCKLCDEQKELAVVDKEISESLFKQINSVNSNINILIGSKKFTEGWSSWRVCTMGLMNIGKKEGSQIIQLFGRGVRLKGFNFSLKRSRRIQGLNAPAHLETIETLNVFGIRADYMRQFKEYLEEEGLPTNEERIEFVLPVIHNLGQKKLKTIKLKEGIDFKKQAPKPTLEKPDESCNSKIVIDWYPRIETLSSSGRRTTEEIAVKDEGSFNSKHIAFMDVDEIYFELQKFKNERAWYNFNLSINAINNLLLDSTWYKLYILNSELSFYDYSQTNKWQQIAVALLKKYCDRFYKNKKAEYENQFLEYRELDINDPNFIPEYLFLIEQSREDIVEKLKEIKELIAEKKLKDIRFQGLNTIVFNGHLYQPLIYLDSGYIEVKPVSLNKGEKEFVEDLRQFFESNKEYFAAKELYLLRNQSKGRGVGFFEAGNFYPDFILWVISDNQQYINFIDPKGLRNLGIHDPKIEFHKTIKDLEQKLADSSITLNSFIISNSDFQQKAWWSGSLSKTEFEKSNVLFQVNDKDTYIRKMFDKIGK